MIKTSNDIREFYNDKALTVLNYYCIDYLHYHLNPKEFKKPDFPGEFLDGPNFGVFVTWLDESREFTRRLRGCIGTFGSGKLRGLLERFTIVSSQEDTRFEKVRLEKLKDFSMSVSILDQMEQCKDPFDWEIGVHGVYVMFEDKGNEYSACYLPEVPKLNNWDKKLTLDRCCKKSGYSKELGHVDEVINKMYVMRFKSVKSSISITEYLESRNKY